MESYIIENWFDYEIRGVNSISLIESVLHNECIEFYKICESIELVQENIVLELKIDKAAIKEKIKTILKNIKEFFKNLLKAIKNMIQRIKVEIISAKMIESVRNAITYMDILEKPVNRDIVDEVMAKVSKEYVELKKYKVYKEAGRQETTGNKGIVIAFDNMLKKNLIDVLWYKAVDMDSTKKYFEEYVSALEDITKRFENNNTVSEDEYNKLVEKSSSFNDDIEATYVKNMETILNGIKTGKYSTILDQCTENLGTLDKSSGFITSVTESLDKINDRMLNLIDNIADTSGDNNRIKLCSKYIRGINEIKNNLKNVEIHYTRCITASETICKFIIETNNANTK